MIEVHHIYISILSCIQLAAMNWLKTAEDRSGGKHEREKKKEKKTKSQLKQLVLLMRTVEQ